MSSKDTEATFSIKLEDDVSDVADNAAESIESLRGKVDASGAKIKELSSVMRQLRGTSDEVKAAKAKLGAELNAERASITTATLAMLKMGATQTNVAKATKDQAASAKALGTAIQNAGGPVANLKSKFDTLKELKSTIGVGGFLVLGVAGLVAALGALAAATASVAVDFGKFILESANAARAANLNREALLGNAADAKALGSQIDALSGKLPLAKSQLNDMAGSLIKSNIGGQALVDTLKAVAGASAAVGDDVGGKLKALVENGKLTKRFQLGRFDLVGTGLNFDDVASQLATSMKVGIAQARQALVYGRVTLAEGAKVLKNAVEKRFGEINARKMLDLNVQVAKFKERISALGSDVKLEPLTKALDSIFSLLDESTATGAAVKQLVTAIGNGLVGSLTNGAPIAKKFFQGMIIGALHLGIGFLRLKRQFSETFSKSGLTQVDMMQKAFVVGKIAAYGLVAGLATIAGAAALAYIGISKAVRAGEAIAEFFKKTDFKAIGASIVDGLVDGVRSGFDRVKRSLTDLGTTAKDALKEALKIRSPSRVFREYGANTAEGFALGIEDKEGRTSSAVGSMGDASPNVRSGGPRGALAGRMPPIELHIHTAATNGRDVARAITSPGVLVQILEALDDALASRGMAAT